MVDPVRDEACAAGTSASSCRGAIAEGVLFRSPFQMVCMDGLLCVRCQAEHVLVAEQCGPKSDEHRVGGTDQRPPAAAALRDRTQRQTGRRLLEHVEPGSAYQSSQR